jgi:hypothetical protein
VAKEERDYSHRSAVEKLGVEPGLRVRMTGDLGDELKVSAKERVGGSIQRRGPVDVIVCMVASLDEADRFLRAVRPTLQGHTAVWLATWKKGDHRYVKQEDLIPIGKRHDLVDNKTCALDDQRSAMRFVVPRSSRGRS